MGLRLIIEDDQGATTIVPLGTDPVTIGRQNGNTIQLTERNVSRRHARLFCDPEGWLVEDLNSYNGIRVNDSHVSGAIRLREGDILQIGDYHLSLSEDVDRQTLNLGSRGKAANDNEPMFASSSSHLPRVSAEELAAIHSGAPLPADLDDDGENEGGRSAITAAIAGIGFAALLIVGAFWFMRDGDAGTANSQAHVDRVSIPEPSPTQAAPPQAVVPAVEPPKPVIDAPPAVANEETAAAEADGGSAVAAPEVEPPEPRRPVRANDKVRKEPKPKREPKTSPPAEKPTPAETVDADALLNAARKASLTGNSEEAYDLARQAYAAKRTAAALEVMGVSACKMGDAGKAKSAYSRLGGSAKANLASLCANRGITLD